MTYITTIYLLLSDKEKKVIHHKNLKQYLDLGFRIKKVHGGISFKEEPQLEKYIELNTKLRVKARNEFEKSISS